LPANDKDIAFVDSVYGPVYGQRGACCLWQRPPLVSGSTDVVEAHFYPDFSLPVLHCTFTNFGRNLHFRWNVHICCWQCWM